jgi:hypothetical protein
MSMIPYAERGKPVAPSAFNRLVDFVRSNLLTSVVGGRLIRTLGGTSIVIDQDVAAGGGGGTPEPYCAYKITDASAGGNLLVLVPYMVIAGKVPQGMVLGEDYLLSVTGTGRVYASIKFDLTTLNVVDAADAVTVFFAEGAPLANTSDTQYEVLATVIVTSDTISSISNRCTLPDPNPCLLPWEPISTP